jgi:hypothetical protein
MSPHLNPFLPPASLCVCPSLLPPFLCPRASATQQQVAIANGAQGIGLTRTEHMFFATHQRIAAVRRMIAAVELQSPAAEEALKELQGYQTQDFEGIFR